jgi:enolase 1/2/3
MPHIRSLTARTILDSRGEWTIEVALTLKNGARVSASVPQGKSTGSHEAPSLPAAVAARSVNNVIAPYLKRHAPRSQAALDAALGSPGDAPRTGPLRNKKLGANATLAVSIAYARAEAATKRTPLWRHIRSLAGFAVPIAHRPRLFINVVNGGLHAGNNLDFQEYLIIPRAGTIKESVAIGTAVYRALGDALRRAKGRGATNLGDEGGYAPSFKDNAEPFRFLRRVAKELRFSKKIDFGMDAAASDIRGWKEGELAHEYATLIRDYRLAYLEDPFGEERFATFARLSKRFSGKPEVGKTLIAGDDLTTTNVRRMEMAHAERSVNAVIIKPNQIGTVSGALAAVRAAKKYGWATVASHRSGETNDDFIADFAFGIGAYGLKLGAPARGERVAKYNRLLDIESREC